MPFVDEPVQRLVEHAALERGGLVVVASGQGLAMDLRLKAAATKFP